MTDRNNLYIPSIDAKDIYITNNYISEESNLNKIGYRTTKKDGSPNYNRFINSFDYSLDLIDLRSIAEKVYKGKDTLSFISNGKEYSSKIINITFKYSVREFNQITHNLYVRNGYAVSEGDLKEGIYYKTAVLSEKMNNKEILKTEHTQLLALKLNTPLKYPVDSDLLPKYFSVSHNKTDDTYTYSLKEGKTIPLVKDSKTLRRELYKNGFICDGIKYRRYKRSCGSSRVGKVLFIDERLYDLAHKSEQCGLSINDGDEIDLAGFEAYIALPASTIIDTLPIDPKNILVMEDYESTFKEKAIRTYAKEDNHLYTEEKEMQITNSIWDGQSLIDISLMGKYSTKGMILLRNKFFKSCCFNTNIQQFFIDNNITSVDQLNGITLAEKIEDIKLITTKSSIKFFKFGDYETWCKNIYPNFGVVKYDKDTHFFDGRMVQTHYQLLNTLQLSYSEVSELLKESLSYLNLLNTDVDVMRFHLQMDLEDNDFINSIMKTKNDIVSNLLKYDCGFENTQIYYEFKSALCKAYKKNLKKGHILVPGTYTTLFGNPYEMLLGAINKFDGTTIFEKETVSTSRYQDKEEVLGIRSPHVTIGNIFIAINRRYNEIDKYFNLTDKIICINSIGENTLERLSGADFDSDQVMLTNHKILLEAAKKYYRLFKVPTRDVSSSKKKLKYTMSDLAELDIETGTNKIGEIVNFSQVLNSLLWDKIHQIGGNAIEHYEEIKSIYYDVCQLDVMSNIEIDKAKRIFDPKCAVELDIMREKYKNELTSNNGKKYLPTFLGYITKLKGFYNKDRKELNKYDTTMDYILKEINGNRLNYSSFDKKPLCDILFPNGYIKDSQNKKQVKQIIMQLEKKQNYITALYANANIDKDARSVLILSAKEDLVHWINKIKINANTMYYLFKCLENKKCSKIKSLFLELLFSYQNDVIYKQLESFKISNVSLVADNQGEIDIYGEKYTKLSLF